MNLHVTIIIIFLSRSTNNIGHKITTKPSSKMYKYNIPLFWKIANKREISAKNQNDLFSIHIRLPYTKIHQLHLHK